MYINDIPSINHPETFRFRKETGHLTDAQLQKAFSDRFVVCKTEEQALEAAKGHQHAYISRLFDYSIKDIVPFGSIADDSGKRTRYRPKEGAQKIYKGWLVSYPSLRLKKKQSHNEQMALVNF